MARRDMDKPGHVKILEGWMRSYRPEELFDERGKFRKRQPPLYSSWAMPRYFRQSVQSIFLVYRIHKR